MVDDERSEVDEDTVPDTPEIEGEESEQHVESPDKH